MMMYDTAVEEVQLVQKSMTNTMAEVQMEVQEKIKLNEFDDNSKDLTATRYSGVPEPSVRRPLHTSAKLPLPIASRIRT